MKYFSPIYCKSDQFFLMHFLTITILNFFKYIAYPQFHLTPIICILSIMKIGEHSEYVTLDMRGINTCSVDMYLIQALLECYC